MTLAARISALGFVGLPVIMVMSRGKRVSLKVRSFRKVRVPLLTELVVEILQAGCVEEAARSRTDVYLVKGRFAGRNYTSNCTQKAEALKLPPIESVSRNLVHANRPKDCPRGILLHLVRYGAMDQDFPSAGRESRSPRQGSRLPGQRE